MKAVLTNVETYQLFSETELKISLFETPHKSKETSVTVSWDPKKTEIISAKLYAKARTGDWYMRSIVSFNDTEIFNWYPTDPEKEGTAAVEGLLKNGFNKCKIYCETWWVGSVFFTVRLEVEFEGEPPIIEEPLPWWVIPVVVGAAATTAGVAVGLAVRR